MSPRSPRSPHHIRAVLPDCRRRRRRGGEVRYLSWCSNVKGRLVAGQSQGTDRVARVGRGAVREEKLHCVELP